jgi:DDE family transposase
MGERTKEALRVHFDARIRLEFHGATLTSDGGLLACCELDDALGVTEAAARYLRESRSGRNVQHSWVSLLRQSVYSRLAGYEDTNDAARLAGDPVMRVITGRRDSEKQAASTNTLSRFETEVLTQKENVQGLAQLNAAWVEKAMARTPHRRVILDIDSSESPVYGEQEGAAYNGHFACVCYHPLFCFNQFGDCEGAMLRPGNVHSAHGWQEVLEPMVAHYAGRGVRLYFRADAAFASPEIYEYLEEHSCFYAIRLPSNAVLEKAIEPLLKRPVGRPPQQPLSWYPDFFYQAASWEHPRRVVAKVEWHQGELFPRVGFIVTNLSAKAEGVVHFYNGRGTAEPWIKEGKYALHWTRLSCHRFMAN